MEILKKKFIKQRFQEILNYLKHHQKDWLFLIMRMSCYYSGLFATYVGIGIVITSLISIFVNNKIVNIVLSVINIIAGVCVHLIPNKIIKISVGMGKDGAPRFMGYCMKDTMECIKHHTFTIVSILGIAVSIISIMYLIYIFIKREN